MANALVGVIGGIACVLLGLLISMVHGSSKKQDDMKDTVNELCVRIAVIETKLGVEVKN